MQKYVIEPSPPLHGEVKISGAKNSALPIMAATLLTSENCTISNIPQLLDTQNMRILLEFLGAEIESFVSKNSIKIVCKNPKNDVSNYDLVNKLRASILVCGPLLARTGKIKIPMPGGCQIGTRPINLHLKGFAALGAKITQGNGYIEARARKLIGTQIYLDFPSVGATENLIMAATLAEGNTTLENAATEPEIIDLAAFLNKLGASIHGAGTDTIKIVGKKSLSGANYKIIADRVEAGTLMIAAAITRGNVTLTDIIPEHLKPVTAKMRESGIDIVEGKTTIQVDATQKIKAADIKTLPFPGFPTDMQAPFTALLAVSDGTSVVIETIFENRFMHIPELRRMGASIKIDGRTAIIEGIKSLNGAIVRATDLRAGASLVIAGLAANNQTEVLDCEHIQRGYVNLEKKLTSLGASVILK
ncbi:MAG: UDP-N-acetylglucosamine 1-carboxyvinyltransferase [Clostridiales bacterium]|jgi:UDP-N-acetylglucosamine 1-carboxyvinyltransferase|nr:UDP-N-acetylglucosamine 1-carboxyvinyltransferase [Clostridiales bacterium]